MNNKILTIVFIFILFASCKTEKIQLTGSITGEIKIFAEDGYLQPDAKAKVTILNTDFSTETGTDCVYKIENIPVGTYDIKYSSDGFEDYTEKGVNITSGKTPAILKTVVLGQKPVSKAKNLRIYTYGFGSKRIAGDIDPAGTENNRKQIVLYIDDKNTVSKDNFYSEKYLTSVADTFYIDYINIQSYFPSDADTVYIIAYTKSFDPEDYAYPYNFNYDEYNMNYEDFTISENPSNIISIPITK